VQAGSGLFPTDPYWAYLVSSSHHPGYLPHRSHRSRASSVPRKPPASSTAAFRAPKAAPLCLDTVQVRVHPQTSTSLQLSLVVTIRRCSPPRPSCKRELHESFLHLICKQPARRTRVNCEIVTARVLVQATLAAALSILACLVARPKPRIGSLTPLSRSHHPAFTITSNALAALDLIFIHSTASSTPRSRPNALHSALPAVASLLQD
jgi:hypothetical protein